MARMLQISRESSISVMNIVMNILRVASRLVIICTVFFHQGSKKKDETMQSTTTTKYGDSSESQPYRERHESEQWLHFQTAAAVAVL